MSRDRIFYLFLCCLLSLLEFGESKVSANDLNQAFEDAAKEFGLPADLHDLRTKPF